MVETVTELVVRVADLVEAEGRQLRHVAIRVAIALGAIIVAGVLALAGLVLLLNAIYQWLLGPLGVGGSLFVTGLIALVLAGGVLWTAMKLAK